MMGAPPKLRLVDRPWLKVQIQLEIRDLWIGLFWRRTAIALHLYLCLIPALPLHVTLLRRRYWGLGDMAQGTRRGTPGGTR